ncbi:nitrate reductase Z subunit beta, partial [Salmonella enterica subsp. enterica serovar Enteritidis str. 13183-1]
MVLNLDKCIGCHTCSVTCKNVWTGREGMEYAWFNNVETKPGIGYPKNWEDQQEWQGGWVRDVNGKIRPRLGGKMGVISKIFANPVIPQIDDYYEPFTFDYQHLHNAPESKHQPTARPRSLIDGKRMDKVIWGPNWEELLGGEFEKRARDRNFDNIQKEMYGQFENTFMMYLPRLCEHCLNPSCVATCPSGAIYKREEDGIVLIDQDKCRGWRLCISGCPYKKSTLTGRAASLRNAYFAIRVLNPASRPFARKPASGASVILAFCSTTPTGLKKRPVPNTRRICMNVSVMCFSIRTIRRSSKRRLNRASRKTSSTLPNGRRCTK